MADQASDYHRGDQNISEQTATYKMFGAMTKWASLIIAALLVLFVVWFCVGAGFFAGLIPAVILLAAGIFFLRSPDPQGH